VVISELLAQRVGEEVLKLCQVSGAGHGNDAFNHAVVFLHSHPTVADEEKSYNK